MPLRWQETFGTKRWPMTRETKEDILTIALCIFTIAALTLLSKLS